MDLGDGEGDPEATATPAEGSRLQELQGVLTDLNNLNLVQAAGATQREIDELAGAVKKHGAGKVEHPKQVFEQTARQAKAAREPVVNARQRAKELQLAVAGQEQRLAEAAKLESEAESLLKQALDAYTRTLPGGRVPAEPAAGKPTAATRAREEE